MAKIIAIDFDGTLFEEKWPNIGKPIMATIKRAKAEQKRGAKLILNTLREGQLLAEALAACEKKGLRFDAVNDNLPEEVAKWGNNPRKIAADEYWDDRAVQLKTCGTCNHFVGKGANAGECLIICAVEKEDFCNFYEKKKLR